MATTPMNQTNLANYIQTIWAKEVQAAVENGLVCGNLVDRQYEKYDTGAGTIVVPVLSNITPSAYNAAADIAYNTTNETAVNISLNQRYYAAYAVDPFTKVQDQIGYFDAAKSKLVYGLNKQIDQSVSTLFASFGNSTGTEGTALGMNELVAAYESLNENDAPETDRAWVFDPESITDLLGIDAFVRGDYVPDQPMANGFTGKRILGAPVFMTNALPAVNTNYHAAAMFHKEAIALVVQQPIVTELGKDIRRGNADVVISRALWGVKEMRDGFGVWIKTRS